MKTLSIIIPALNEEQALPKNLETIAGLAEVIVVDGGSSDGTVSIAEKAGATVIQSSPGRGRQMNTGAKISSGDHLLFLHADTHPPAGFRELIEASLADQAVAVGTFALGFDSYDRRLVTIAKWANLRSRFLHLPYGDQGFFMRRTVFEEAGGFPEIAIMEDFVFIRTMKKFGKIIHLQQPVTTSSRRWQNLGFFKTTIINQIMVAGYLLKVSPERLAKIYGRLRGLK